MTDQEAVTLYQDAKRTAFQAMQDAIAKASCHNEALDAWISYDSSMDAAWVAYIDSV